ncbi:hypothetical protein Q427_31605 [Halomonas sp. BC04]|nr:hypothetical protein Q427_31605 [Halomonas sp. BC04]
MFFKGPALAASYYGDPAGRFCRDIDLLVSHGDMVALLEMAIRSGYRLLEPEGIAADRQSLAFAVDAHPVITLVSPQGVPVELHRRLDKMGAIYDTGSLLSNVENLPWGNASLSVMPTDELFVYVCLHHTRHRWSHLHWLVDLDAIQRSAGFNSAKVQHCARQRGLTATVDAALELYRACSLIGNSEVSLPDTPGRELLCACLTNLQGDRQTELAQRRKNISMDFAFSWQVTMVHRWACCWRKWCLMCRPSYMDYRRFPLPPRWRWLYWLMRPWRYLLKRLV